MSEFDATTAENAKLVLEVQTMNVLVAVDHCVQHAGDIIRELGDHLLSETKGNPADPRTDLILKKLGAVLSALTLAKEVGKVGYDNAVAGTEKVSDEDALVIRDYCKTTAPIMDIQMLLDETEEDKMVRLLTKLMGASANG